jgi:hypothetical protein
MNRALFSVAFLLAIPASTALDTTPAIPEPVHAADSHMMTEAEYAEFLAELNDAVSVSFPGVARVGAYAGDVIAVLFRGVTVIDEDFWTRFLELLPSNGCIQAPDPVACIVHYVITVSPCNFAAGAIIIAPYAEVDPNRRSFYLQSPAVGATPGSSLPVSGGRISCLVDL